MRHTPRLKALCLIFAGGVLAPGASFAADPWDPFSQLETARPSPRKKSIEPAPDAPASATGNAAPEYGVGVPYGGTANGPAGGSSYGAAQPFGGTTPAGTNPTTDATVDTPVEPGRSLAPPLPAAYATPTTQTPPPPLVDRSGAIEKGDLAPVIANDGSGLPYELWTGLDVAALEALIARLEIPPRSPALHSLWHRLITSNITAPGASTDGRFNALRAEALYRSGLLDDAANAVNADGSALAANTGLGALAARVEIARANTTKGCERVKSFIARKAELPKKLQGEALLMTGICAAAGGNPNGAGLAAEFAREDKSLANGTDDAVSLAALDAIASGQKTPVRNLKSLSLLQYRAFAFAGGVDAKDIGDKGEAALLSAIAADPKAPPTLQLTVGEAAARINAIPPANLAALYRAHGPQSAPEALLAANATKADGPLHRAALFKAAEVERTPLKKVRIMRSLLDDAKRAGLYLQTLDMLAKTAESLQPVSEIGWFAETGIEISLASANPERARQWSNLGGSVPGDGGLRHWQALIDIADPVLKTERGRALTSVEGLATRGRLSPDLLHRLATVLDANDINVPLPLWNAANRAPQPTGGYLPETGILTTLQDASKKKEFGRTVLLVMRALGPNGAEGAHLIALGDSIRALRRAGLETDARRLSFESLFAVWPRAVSN